MDISEAIKHIKKAVDEEIPHLKQLRYDNQEDYYLWHSKMQNILEASFGRASDKYVEFCRIARFTEFSRNLSLQKDLKQRYYLDNLTKLETVLKSIIQKYEMLGIETTPAAMAERPKAFIAHEGETKALNKLKTFLDALGVKYLIAEIEPSNGRGIEAQVKNTYRNADFAIILATKGKVINKKTKVPYMGMNVADELGKAREVLKNKIILLLQTGVEPHTNISEIVHERFSPNSMDKAFIKVAKELKNWGFIRARKI